MTGLGGQIHVLNTPLLLQSRDDAVSDVINAERMYVYFDGGRDRVKGLFKCGNAIACELGPFPCPSIQGSDLAPSHLGDGTMAVGGPIDGEIVEETDHAILGGFDVELDGVHSQIDGLAKSQQSVLWIDTGKAAMGDNSYHVLILRAGKNVGFDLANRSISITLRS